MPASAPAGSPTARIQSSLRRSALQVFRLTLPGSDLIAAHTSGPSASPAPPALSASAAGSPGSSSAAAISDHIRALTSPSRRPATLAVSASSDLRSADPMIRPIRSLDLGCSIRSSRILASSASRTRGACRSRLHTSSASHAVSFSASATVNSRNPVNFRIKLCSRSAVRPSQSNSPMSDAGTFTCRATQATASSGSSERPDGSPLRRKNFSHKASPSFTGPVRPASSLTSSPTRVQCSISSSSSSTRATAAPPADRQSCLHPTNPPQYWQSKSSRAPVIRKTHHHLRKHHRWRLVAATLRTGRIRSPEAIYARVTGLLAQAPKAAPGDDQPVVITTRGPLARAFRDAAQSIAPGAIVPGGTDARKLVQLAAAPTPEERLRAVEEMLAASAVVPQRRSRFPARARPGGAGPLRAPDRGRCGRNRHHRGAPRRRRGRAQPPRRRVPMAAGSRR